MTNPRRATKGRPCQHRGKAMGSIAKSGTSPIVEVLSPAESPRNTDSSLRQRLLLTLFAVPRRWLRHRPAGVHDRPRHTLWFGCGPGHQGVQPQRDEGAVVRLIDISAGHIATGEAPLPMWAPRSSTSFWTLPAASRSPTAISTASTTICASLTPLPSPDGREQHKKQN